MKLNIRNLFAGLVIIIVLAFVFFRGDQLVELVETMKQGSPAFMAVAVLTQLGKYFAQSFAYHYAFKAVGEHMAPRNTLPLVFGTFFMNTIAPSLNLAGTTLVVDDARRRGIPAGKATSAALLMQITIDSGFTVIMLLGFLVLAVTVGLDPVWFLLGLLVIALVGGMVFVMVMGRKRPQVMIKLLSVVDRLINRVLAKLGKASLKPWVERTVGSFSEAAGLIAHQPKTTAKAFGCSIFASVCELSCFCLVGVGFGVHSPEALMCGYVVATLFAMISVTPQGVGVVEAAVTVAFTSFGQAASAGLSIALVYRGIVFWMPFVIGAVLIQTTKTFRGGGAKKAVEETARHVEEDPDTKTFVGAAMKMGVIPEPSGERTEESASASENEAGTADPRTPGGEAPAVAYAGPRENSTAAPAEPRENRAAAYAEPAAPAAPAAPAEPREGVMADAPGSRGHEAAAPAEKAAKPPARKRPRPRRR